MKLGACRSRREQFLFPAEGKDDGHSGVDVIDCFVGLGCEDGEVGVILFGRVEFGWPACVDASHGERFARLLQHDA